MDSTSLLKIGDFAKLAGTNLRTLRYYEELGLLQPAERSQCGFRYYRPTDINRLDMIRQLQDLGMQLEDIRGLLTSRNEELDQPAFLAKVRSILKRHDELLQARMAELDDQRLRVKRALSKISDCTTCDQRPNAKNNFCEPCHCSGEALPKFVSALF